MSKLYKPP